jgi:hypothetical protein
MDAYPHHSGSDSTQNAYASCGAAWVGSEAEGGEAHPGWPSEPFPVSVEADADSLPDARGARHEDESEEVYLPLLLVTQEPLWSNVERESWPDADSPWFIYGESGAGGSSSTCRQARDHASWKLPVRASLRSRREAMVGADIGELHLPGAELPSRFVSHGRFLSYFGYLQLARRSAVCRWWRRYSVSEEDYCASVRECALLTIPVASVTHLLFALRSGQYIYRHALGGVADAHEMRWLYQESQLASLRVALQRPRRLALSRTERRIKVDISSFC